MSHFTPQTRCHGEGKEDTRVTPRARHSSPVCCLSLPGLQLVGQRLRPPPGPSSRELATQRLVPQPPGAPAAPAGKSRAQAGNCPHRGPLPAPGAAAHPPPPARPPASLPSPAGRLQKRLRAARRCWRVSGLQSLLWPFRHRFSLAPAPERSRPLRAMLDPAPRAAAHAPFRFRRPPPS